MGRRTGARRWTRLPPALVLFLLLVAPTPSRANVFGGVPVVFDDELLVKGEEDGGSVHNLDYGNAYEYEEYDDSGNGTTDDVTSTTHRPPGSTGGGVQRGALHFTLVLTNVTKEAGETVRLRCEAEGGARRIRWLKNEAPVVEERGRVAIRSYVPGASGGHQQRARQHHGATSGATAPGARSFPVHKEPKFRSTDDDRGATEGEGPSEPSSAAPEPLPIGSRLRISSLETHDMGFYTCVASDGRNSISSTAVLYVNANRFGHIGVPVTIPNFSPIMPDFPALSGNIPSAGGPPGGLPPLPQPGAVPGTGGRQSERRPPEGGGSHAGGGVEGVRREHHPQGYCQVYQGTTCAQIIGNRSVYVPASLTQEVIEQKVQRALTVIAQSRDLTARCGPFAVPSVCYTAFPICQTDDQSVAPPFFHPPPASGQGPSAAHLQEDPPGGPSALVFSPSDPQLPLGARRSGRPRLLCREECEVLVADVCRVEYAIAKRHPLIGKSLGEPDCPSLPPIESAAARTCLRLGLPEVRELIKHGEECYSGHGETYRGPVSISSSGRPCLPWGNLLDAPSSSAMVAGDDPPSVMRVLQEQLLPLYSVELVGGHSYCRNPGGMQSRPWCFVQDGSPTADVDWVGGGGEQRPRRQVRMEFCTVPQCADHMWLYILAAGGGGVLFLLLLCLIIFCSRRRCRGRSGPQSLPPSGLDSETCPLPAGKQTLGVAGVKANGGGGAALALEMNALLPKGGSGGPPTAPERNAARAREYPLSNVRFLQELGEGAFGKVYKGEVWCSETESPLPVAVKALKENASPKTVSDFRREVELMSELRHPNIVCLVGVVPRGEPLCMLFEYMAQGDLHEYLMTHSPRAESDGVLPGNMDARGGKLHVLNQYELLYIATQVAAGMEYLSAQHYVHRDLAARNCLVGDGLCVKISDFGLSRDVYSSDYYRVQSKSLLPVRWMPTESILYGKFTTDSDVWSFGVLLWEVYTFGLQPYYGYSNQEVIEMIRSRQLLPRPEDCPVHVYGLMQDCWHQVPSRRPPFPILHANLRSWLLQQHQHQPPPAQRPTEAPTRSANVGSSVAGSSSSSSQRSSTGPSNNTGSTRLSSSGKSATNAAAVGGSQTVVRLSPPSTNHVHQSAGKIANI